MRCGDEDLKVVAMFMFHEWHPDLWYNRFCDIASIVDEMAIRIDTNKTSPELVKRLQNETGLPIHIKLVTHNFNADVWREGLIRQLDQIKPDIVVALDSDEAFEAGILKEIGAFWNTTKKAMMCSFNSCCGDDGRSLPVYPSKPHMKIFKWEPGLTFVPYMGYAQVTQYANRRDLHWMAVTKINHYCMWTKEMEAAKREEVKTRYGRF